MKLNKSKFVLATVAISFCWAAARAEVPAASKASLQATKGRIVAAADGTVTAQDAATLSIGPAPSGPYRFEARVQLAERSGRGTDCQFTFWDAKEPKIAQAAAILGRDSEGYELTFRLQSRNPQNRLVNVGPTVAFKYWPNEQPAKPNWMVKDKAAFKPPPTAGEKLKKAGIAERSWHGRWCSLLVELDGGSFSLWFDGRFVGTVALASAWQCPVTLLLNKDDRIRQATLAPHPADRMMPIDVQPSANDRFAAEFKDQWIKAGGVPFRLPQGTVNQLSLRQAHWTGWNEVLNPYGEPYQGGAPMLFDERMPMLRIPPADYVAAHVLAVADDDTALTSALTLRVGSYKSTTVGNYLNTGLVDWFDFTGAVPRKADLAAGKGGEVVQTSAGPLARVRVPMGRSIAQDFGPALDVELTKELRFAGRSTYRPLGLPSGVRIAAITFEKSPLQMKVSASEPGNAFLQPQKPTFQVQLHNITAQEQPFTLAAVATHLDGMVVHAKAAGKVVAGAAQNVSLEIAVPKRGYYDLAVTLSDGADRLLMTRKTSLALLPPDMRKHRETSPFGTWQFGGGHYASTEPDLIGPLYVKAGLRYGMWGFKSEEQMKYGVIQSPEPCIVGWTARLGLGAEGYRHAVEQNPTVGLDPNPVALLFHEDGFGTGTTEEKAKNFQAKWDDAVKAAQSMRKEFPKVKLALGNGEKYMREEFYRHKFPSDLFDFAGLEAGSGYPETQPGTGGAAVNVEIWMERQLLDSYGYTNKPVYLCSESCYPSTGPGRLNGRTQADYLIRHSLHALAWDMPGIRFGIISDAGSSYYFTMWGGAGLCNRMPELNVKPAYVAMATLTTVLDGAKFERDLDLGSPSLYGLEFCRPDGSRVVAMWTPRGRRPVKFVFESKGPFTLIDSQANETPLEVKDGAVEVTLSPSPAYLITPAPVKSAQPGVPNFDDKPVGTSVVLSSLSNLDDWTGDSAFEGIVKFEGKDKVLKVTPRPNPTSKDTATAPTPAKFISELTHKNGIPMPGTPTEIGLWVNGNSSWGRVIFVLQDAAGKQWRSLSESPPIDFDGWRYLAVRLPGQYAGPENRHWPRDKDGVAQYPLTFKKLIVELPEKSLHVKTLAPAPRPEIYVKDLTVAQDGTTMLKTTVGERD